MEKFKPSKASITTIIIASILSAIFYFNPNLLLHFPYNIKVWYRDYEIKKRVRKTIRRSRKRR